jgi:nanoRNase/pAp phosphatase (c-di-AMP/oligoRNAs hydrolase)
MTAWTRGEAAAIITGSNVLGMAQAANNRATLPALLQAIARPGPIVILPHDNPDPDALASAATLSYLFRELAKRESIIALGGIVGRAENRAMLTYLNINLVPVSSIEFTPDTLIALVDTQPGRTNNSLPEAMMPTVVIDHHPAYTDFNGVAYLDLRSEYGATSTILAEYLRESKLPIDSKIATALFYGIASETQDLGREATPADVALSQFLYPYANKRRLSKIENARVPAEYFRGFRDAIEEAKVYDKVVISVLHEVQYPDMVAEVADFLLRLDSVEWAAAMGFYHKSLHVSLRTINRDINAGDVLQKVLGSRSAGGHDMIAGGRIRVEEGGVGMEKMAVKIKDRLLKTLAVDRSNAKSLVA